MKKLIPILLCVALILTAFAGCAKTEPPATDADQPAPSAAAEESAAPETAGTVHLTLFTGKAEAIDVMNEIINAFNAENPGIVVMQEYQKDASNVIKVKFASGDEPDIVTTYEQEFVDQGKYADFSNEDQWWSRMIPSMKESCTDLNSGKQYRICTNMTMAGLFYNKAIFAELGLSEATTWDEFVANLEAIKAAKPDVTPLFVPGKEAWSLGHLIEFLPHGYIKQKYGATEAKKAFLSNDQTKLDFGTPGGSMETFAADLLDLQAKGLINDDVLTATADNQTQAFANGEAAYISQGMWVLGGLLAANPDCADNIGFSPYPAYMPDMKPVVLSAEDSGYSITASSEYKDQAKQFLDFLFNADNQKLYSETLKAPCAFTDVTADWSVIADEVTGALQRGYNIGFTNEKPAGFTGDDAGRMVQELLAGMYTPEQFAQAYKEAWDSGM